MALQEGRFSVKDAVNELTKEPPQEGNNSEEDDQNVLEDEETFETDSSSQSDEDFEEQSDEDTSNDAEGEVLEADSESDDEEESDAEQEMVVYDVPQPDGSTLEVEDSELVAGYMRQQDHSRRLQDLAAERKQTQAEQQEAREARDRYLAATMEMEQQLKTNFGLSDELLQKDPNEYARRREVLGRFEEERKRLAQEQHQEAQRDFSAYVQGQQQQLLQALPEWQDPGVASQEKAKLRSYALSVGYTEQEIPQIVDHRNVMILRKAMLYDMGQGAVSEAAKKKVAKAKAQPKGNRRKSQPKFARRVVKAQQDFDKATKAKSGGQKKAIKAGVDLLLAREEAAAKAAENRGRRRRR